MRSVRRSITIFMLLTFVTITNSYVLNVDPNTKTLIEARDEIRDFHRHNSQEEVTINLLPGVHKLYNETLILDERDSFINWRGSNTNSSIISGGKSISNFQTCPKNNKLFCAPVPPTLKAQPRHLYVNGRRAGRSVASVDVVNAFANPKNVTLDWYVISKTNKAATEILKWSKENIDAVELVFTANGSPWTESRCTLAKIIESKDDIQIYVKNPCFSIVQTKPCGQSTSKPAHIENTDVTDLLPGMWMLDRSSSTATIVYYPLKDEKLVDVVMPFNEQLISATNTMHSTFSNIIFEYTTWSRPNGPLGYIEQQSGALVDFPGTQCNDYEWKPMPSNIVFKGTIGVVIEHCTFQHMGAGSLQFDDGAQNNIVQDSTFYDISGTSVQLGGYDTFNITNENKQEIGNIIRNNNITLVANEYHGNAGISVGYSKNTTISHNFIQDLTYSGISIYWGWARELKTYAGNNFVDSNRITNFKLQKKVSSLGDGGGIYALGPQKNSYMVNNWISNMGSGRGGGGFYPDEGSAFWTISNNVFSNSSFCLDDCEWLHIWTKSIHNITVSNCFTDTKTQENHGTNTFLKNITYVTKNTPINKWPKEAIKIMLNSGIKTVKNLEVEIV
eukprot:g294.t1